MNEHTTREEAIRIAEDNREQRRQAEIRNERAAADIARLVAQVGRMRHLLREAQVYIGETLEEEINLAAEYGAEPAGPELLRLIDEVLR